MSIFSVHTLQSAPEASRPILEGAHKNFGFVPNLLGALAEAPAALEAYVALTGLVEKSSFSAAEQQVILIATSVENGCEYCVAAHSTIASMQKLPADVIGGLRQGTEVADARLEALRKFTTILVTNRGHASDQEVQDFLTAGFTRKQVLEVVLGITMKTLSNYANHLIDTPVDAAFAPQAWEAPQAREARKAS